MVDQSIEDNTAPAASSRSHTSIYDVFAVFCKETWIEKTVAPGHTIFKMKELDQSPNMRSARARLGHRADCWAELQQIGRAGGFEFKGRKDNHSSRLRTYRGADLMSFDVAEPTRDAGSGALDGWLDNILRHREEGWLLFDVSFLALNEAPKTQSENKGNVSEAVLLKFLIENSDGNKTESEMQKLAETLLGVMPTRRWDKAWRDPRVKKRRRGETDKTLKARSHK